MNTYVVAFLLPFTHNLHCLEQHLGWNISHSVANDHLISSLGEAFGAVCSVVCSFFVLWCGLPLGKSLSHDSGVGWEAMSGFSLSDTPALGAERSAEWWHQCSQTSQFTPLAMETCPTSWGGSDQGPSIGMLLKVGLRPQECWLWRRSIYF